MLLGLDLFFSNLSLGIKISYPLNLICQDNDTTA